MIKWALIDRAFKQKPEGGGELATQIIKERTLQAERLDITSKLDCSLCYMDNML